ncbi:hypothetical protein JHK86_017169 [Glycine max]|nr:hypothetical protein JHK86_017169 [Glycine max]
MKGLFVTKFESKENCKLQKKSPQLWWLFYLCCFTQFGVLLSPIALKLVDPFLLDSNSSRYDINPPFQFPI